MYRTESERRFRCHAWAISWNICPLFLQNGRKKHHHRHHACKIISRLRKCTWPQFKKHRSRVRYFCDWICGFSVRERPLVSSVNEKHITPRFHRPGLNLVLWSNPGLLLHLVILQMLLKRLTIGEYIKRLILKRQTDRGSARNTKFQALFK